MSYVDPECRFAARASHRCHRRDGRALRYGEACHAEARAQLADQAAASNARAKAAGPGPQYRYTDPAVGRAMDAHAGCPSSAMEYGEHGARCTSCGVTWPIVTKVVGRDKDGKPITRTGYLDLPAVARPPERLVSGLFD